MKDTLDYKLIDNRDLVRDLCNLLSNNQVIKSQKERSEIIFIIITISTKLYILGINDLLRYCEDAFINFYAYSKELSKRDKRLMSRWACNGVEYDLYTSKKIELAYLKKYTYFKLDDVYYLDLISGYHISIKDQTNKRRFDRVRPKKTKDIDEFLDLSDAPNDDRQFHTRWFWRNQYKDEMKGWIEFTKPESIKLEEAYKNGLSFVNIGDCKYNVDKMYLKNYGEKYPSKYLLRKTKYEPLKHYNSLSKDQYKLLKSKIKLLLAIESEEQKQQKEIEATKTISPYLQITLELVIDTILKNNKRHIINRNFI